MRHSGAVSEQKRIAVLAGGWSDQRAASLQLGNAMADALRARGIEVLVLDPVQDLVRLAAQLVSARADLLVDALIAEEKDLHGAIRLFGTRFVIMNDAAQIDALADQVK